MTNDPTHRNDPSDGEQPTETPPIRVPPPNEPIQPPPDAPVGEPVPRRPGY